MAAAVVPIRRETPTERLEALVTRGLDSEHSKRSYLKSLRVFLQWRIATCPGAPLSRDTVFRFREHLATLKLSPGSTNLRLAALRKLTVEAAEDGLITRDEAAAIRSIRSVRRRGSSIGNWLTKAQVEKLVNLPNTETLRGLRDRALLMLMVGSGLRRDEVVALRGDQLQMREGRWVIVDLRGKGGVMRSVPIPAWAKAAIDRYEAAPGDRPIFRAIDRKGHSTEKLSDRTLHKILVKYGRQLGIPDLSPHDLRRTYAKLAANGRALMSQIQMSLGHASITTTQVYLGSQQNFTEAPCDLLGLDLSA